MGKDGQMKPNPWPDHYRDMERICRDATTFWRAHQGYVGKDLVYLNECWYVAQDILCGRVKTIPTEAECKAVTAKLRAAYIAAKTFYENRK